MFSKCVSSYKNIAVHIFKELFKVRHLSANYKMYRLKIRRNSVRDECFQI